MKLKLILTIFFICIGVYGFSENFSDIVKPQLVYDTSLLESEKIIKVGVLYKIKPNWHIYWKNAGDSGLPTTIVFNFPEGFEASDINWPIPNAYMREGDILDYGYEEEVLLWTEVKVPDSYNHSDFPVGVNTSWISCEEICIPAKAQYTENLNRNHTNNLFHSWTDKLPTERNNRFDIKIISGKNKYKIVIDNEGLGNNFKLFPNPGKAIGIESVSYKDNDNNQSDINFRVIIYAGHELTSNKIETVISYIDNNNLLKGFEYSINIEDLIVKNSD